MKTLLIILSLILGASNNSIACNLNSSEIREISELADEVAKRVENDEDYKNIAALPDDQQMHYSSLAMKPIDKNSKTLGNIKVETVANDGSTRIISSGSGEKIGRSCVLTTAHVLYGSGYQEISPENNGKFSGKIKFELGAGENKKSMDASVLFQMTTEGKDFYIRQRKKTLNINGKKVEKIIKERIFYGHSDPIILKLNEGADDNYKKVVVVSPDELFSSSRYDIEVGKKITCQGSPTHVAELLKDSTCKASEFNWEQKNARIFADDGIVTKNGVISNIAASAGMSGGPCYLNDNPDYVFGVLANGYTRDSAGKSLMPLIKFNEKEFASGNARYIGLLHKLDERMRSELNISLNDIAELCK